MSMRSRSLTGAALLAPITVSMLASAGAVAQDEIQLFGAMKKPPGRVCDRVFRWRPMQARVDITTADVAEAATRNDFRRH